MQKGTCVESSLTQCSNILTIKTAEITGPFEPMSVDETAFFSAISDQFRPATDWRSASGRDVTVAIIDSGIDSSHPDLSGRVVESVEAQVERSRAVFAPSVSGDSAGHGTACAGIVAR